MYKIYHYNSGNLVKVGPSRFRTGDKIKPYIQVPAKYKTWDEASNAAEELSRYDNDTQYVVVHSETDTIISVIQYGHPVMVGLHER